MNGEYFHDNKQINFDDKIIKSIRLRTPDAHSLCANPNLPLASHE
jgi:hypothetical protein